MEDELERRLRSMADDLPTPTRPLEDTLVHGQRRERRGRARRTAALTGGFAAVLLAGIVFGRPMTEGVDLRVGGSGPDTVVPTSAPTPPATAHPSSPSPAEVAPPVKVRVVREPTTYGAPWCYELTAGDARREACLTQSGPSIWTIGRYQYVVAERMVQVDGRFHMAEPGERLAIRPVARGQRIQGVLCFDPGVAEALLAWSPDASPYSTMGCGDDGVDVLVESKDPAAWPLLPVVVLRVDGGWTVAGQMSAELCDSLPPSSAETCRFLVPRAGMLNGPPQAPAK